MVEKLTLNSLATALLDIPAVSMPLACSHFVCVPFIVPSTRCTCVMIMLFNQLLYMPHLSGGWSFSAKEKHTLTGI
jgi:hypothetical protein